MSNAGMGMMFTDYSRATGSKPVSDTTYTGLAMAADRENAIADSKKGLYYNLLATDNAGSALSRLIDRSPSTPNQFMASLTSSFFNFRQVFGGSLLAVISPAQAGLDEYANPNKFQRYGFTDAEINAYDIGDTFDASGKVITQGLTSYFETPITTAAGQEVARIDIVGNPDAFQFGNEDQNKNDILHCFVNSFINPYAEGASVDPVCLDIGYLTQNSTVKPATEAQYSAGIEANVYKDWCTKNSPTSCPSAAADEMLRYRLYLAYQNTAEELFNTAMTDAESKAAGASLNSPFKANAAATTPATGPAAGTNGKYSWPVDVAGSSVVSCFGPRAGKNHPGDDIAKPLNSPVYASQAGTVVFEGPMSGYGNNFVVIDHGGGTYTSYGHMNGANVKNGQTVTQGQQIGIIGTQGFSQGPHVHFNLFIGGKSWADGINGNVEPLTHGLALPAGIPISGSNCAGIHA
jgi:murein DD-endopeptidase MepM/ murein hydrolase activator NlpD